jgi:hypothetical protein
LDIEKTVMYIRETSIPCVATKATSNIHHGDLAPRRLRGISIGPQYRDQAVSARDLFAGCSVTIMAVGHRWAVGLADENASTLAVATYESVEDALMASRQWLGLLGDESHILRIEVPPQAEKIKTLRKSAVHVLESDEPVDEIVLQAFEDRQKLRAWFGKQIGLED